MSRFEDAIIGVLEHEGGYANSPHDNGGATNWGISIRFLIKDGGLTAHPDLDMNHDGLLDYQDIKLMTKEQACAIYKSDWWDKYDYGQVKDQRVANKILDISVNMGPSRAHKIIQKSLNFCGKSVVIDGVFGPNTLAAVNRTDPDGLLHIIKQQQADFYRALVASNPSQTVWLKGWLNRANA